MVKHWLTDHVELEEPPVFKMKVVGSFRDALTRQISESVRIDLRGGGVLNSKTEYSRCRIPRLVVDVEEWSRKKAEESKKLEEHPPDSEVAQSEESWTRSWRLARERQKVNLEEIPKGKGWRN